MTGLLSIVLPSYNEELNIEHTAKVLKGLLASEEIPCELIFVNDGSKDHTWEEILKVEEDYPDIVGVNFSRNFGKEAAILAGLATATGDCCVVMDCDLQHPPETVIEMYRLWQEGYEVVEGIKKSRGKEGKLHKASAGLFYKIMSSATRIDMSRASDFKLMDRKVVSALLEIPERNSFFRGLSSWVGFRSVSVEFDVQERNAGESKWSTISLIKYAIRNISAFSAAPLQLVTFGGLITFLFAIIVGIQTLVRYCSGAAVEGFTTVILLLLIIGSVLMISLGMIGYYLAKIYEEVKARPRYIISQVLGKESSHE